jgi:hypothetical protein
MATFLTVGDAPVMSSWTADVLPPVIVIRMFETGRRVD